jgi:predicted ribosomally synthesized peptide with SipW-like signal peptide
MKFLIRHSPSGRSRTIAAMLLLGLVALAAGGATWAAYTATTENSGARIEAGSVRLDDNDDGSPLLSLSAAQPGATDSGCIKVTFAGSLDSDVRLYGTTTGSGLDQYLDVEVTRGTYSPTEPGFDSCTNFQPDATNYIGAGNGVVYNGTLQGYADSYAAGLVDPLPGSPENWTTGEVHLYRIDVTLQNNSAAEGLNATQTFTWEARNQ